MRAWSVPLILWTLCGGCAPAVPPGHSVSVGTPSRGHVRAPVQMPARGRGFRSVRDPASSWGTRRLVDFLERAARSVRDRLGPEPELRVGDLSLEGGGKIDGHGSHRSGRDVDLVFFAGDGAGRPVDSGSTRYDRFGRPVGAAGGARFDTRRNWALVRAMLTDPEVEVQWIFCSHGLKVLLLEQALAEGEDIELVRRAAWILHRPTNARPHDDHFHVRIFCSAEERAFGCIDGAPEWEWARRDDARPAATASDSELLGALAPEPNAASALATGTGAPPRAP